MDTRRYLKHFLIVMSGNALGQAITFVTYPFLARSYTPHDFGVFTIFTAVAAMAGAIACGRFEVAVQVASDTDKFAVHALSQLVNLASSLLAGVLSLLYWAMRGGELGPGLAVLVGIAVFLIGYTNASSLLLIKNESYRLNSMGTLLRTLLTAIPQLALFYVWPTPLGLAVGFCLGLFAQAVFLALLLRAEDRARVTAADLRQAFGRYKRYLLDVPNQLLAAFTLDSLSFVLLALYTTEQVGFYSVAYRLLGLPLGLISSSLSQVYFQKAAQSYRTAGVFWNEFRFNLVAASSLSAVIFISLALLSQPLVRLYLGETWIPSAEIMLCLAPLIALRFVSISIASTPLITGKLHWLLLNNLALIGGILLSALLARLHAMTLNEFLVLYVALSSAVHLVFIAFVAVHTRLHFVARPLERA